MNLNLVLIPDSRFLNQLSVVFVCYQGYIAKCQMN